MDNSINISKRPIILVIDANPNNIKVIYTNFSQQNFDLLMAKGGKQAIDIVQENKPDLILLDILLPDMDGFELAHQLKSTTRTQDIPIIFLATEISTELISQCFEIGAVDYITKPFNVAELTSKLNFHLQLISYQDVINQKNVDLERLSLDKTEFLGIAAHDLKNPIYNISMLAKVIKDEDLDKEEIDEFAGDIISTSERMLELIINLLEINAIEQGRMKMNIESILLGEVAKSCVDNYLERAKAKGISLYYSAPENMPTVYSDSGFIVQILDNLISNALKYSPFDKNVWITLKTDVGKAFISIKDEGPGLSELDQKKLFGKFAKLTPRPTGDEHSTGLGLSIAKGYAESLKGDIKLVSILGEGCDFTLELPLI